MKPRFCIPVVLLALSGPAFAGDAAKGESEFRKCKSCHSIVANDGTVIVRGGKTGPNLYGVMGRPVASLKFNYGDSIRQAGANGLVWNEANLVAYVQDPKKWLVEVTGDAGAKTAMSFKLGRGGEDIAAYLQSVVQ